MDNCFEQEFFAFTKKETKLAFNIIANRSRHCMNSSVSSALKVRNYQKIKSWKKSIIVDINSN